MAETVQTLFERCCRLCAKEQDVTIMIFSDEAEAMLLQKKLHKYLLIEVSHNSLFIIQFNSMQYIYIEISCLQVGEKDALPKNICIKCCTKLQTVCEFIEQTHKAQEKLLHLTLVSDVKGKSTIAIKSDHENSDNEGGKTTKLGINVDPMLVLQNSVQDVSPPSSDNSLSVQDVTHLHDVDSENVTIKLIRNGEIKSDGHDESFVNVKPFPCKTCKRSFFTELALKNHSWIHVIEKPDSNNSGNTSLETGDKKSDVTNLRQYKITNGLCEFCGRM